MNSRDALPSDLVEAHRGKDLEVPLWELEQRVDKLEKWSQSLSVELVEQMADKVSMKLKNNMATYLPSVAHALLTL